MKSFIWDLDGTLIDSYSLIVETIRELLKKISLDYNDSYIYDFVKRDSVLGFFDEVITKRDIVINKDEIMSFYSNYIKSREASLVAIDEAVSTLRILKSKGHKHYIYTHNGRSTHQILKQNKMYDFFDEIVTNENGFKRKPDPEALDYLIDKYSMDRTKTYYIGDRSLDVECANNAGIISVFFNPDMDVKTKADIEIKTLKEILEI